MKTASTARPSRKSAWDDEEIVSLRRDRSGWPWKMRFLFRLHEFRFPSLTFIISRRELLKASDDLEIILSSNVTRLARNFVQSSSAIQCSSSFFNQFYLTEYLKRRTRRKMLSKQSFRIPYSAINIHPWKNIQKCFVLLQLHSRLSRGAEIPSLFMNRRK